MNKYLRMCAAATIATSAGSGVVRASTTVYFSGQHYFCDDFVITKSAGGLYAAVHHGGVTCAPTTYQNDAGVKTAKTKGPVAGTAVQFADTTFAKAGAGYDGVDFDLGLPFGSAAWAILVNETGTSTFVVNSGHQSLAKVGPNSGISTLSDAIKALRLANK
jgi:hypothetical protein